MILVQLQGGIGNQMFQYAFGRMLSLKQNVPLKFDLSFLQQKSDQYTHRKFELEVFNIQAEIASQTEINKFSRIYNNKFLKRIHSIVPFSPYYILREKLSYMKETIDISQKNTWVIGFWQSPKYFESIENIIRKNFQFKPPLSDLNAEIAKHIKNSNSVSIHIRRGDYVTNPETNQFHGVCDFAYYKEAINYIASKRNDLKLFVFSDEPEWVNNNLFFDQETIYIKHNTGPNSYNDMHLMSLCKYNITANSSFSWWGAWLNNNPEKLVIAPKHWFNNKDTDTSDLIPESWIRL